MPYRRSSRRFRRSSRRRSRRRQTYGAPIGRAPRFTRKARVFNNLTRDCRWFNAATTAVISAQPSPNNFHLTFSPQEVPDCKDFTNWAKCWEEFKVLKVIVKFIPASVGTESIFRMSTPAVQPNPPDIAPAFARGNTLIWVDQGRQDNLPTVDVVENLIVRPSCKLLQGRRYQKRYIFRPKGYPVWGQLAPNGTVYAPDTWDNTWINLYGENYVQPIAPATGLVYWYISIAYKVIFRGRQQQHYVAPAPLTP